MENQEIINQVKNIINLASEGKKEKIKKILTQNLTETKIIDPDKVGYCSCGFPINQFVEGKYSVISELVKHEVDFRSYREFLYCPNCSKLLETIQH